MKCKLPGCTKKARKKFCCNNHKDKFYNRYKRIDNRYTKKDEYYDPHDDIHPFSDDAFHH